MSDLPMSAAEHSGEYGQGDWTFETAVNCAVCPACAFTFDEDHEESHGGGYSCPCCAELRLTRDNEKMAKALYVAHSAVGILYEKAIGDEVRAVIQTALDIISDALPRDDSGRNERT